MNLRAVALGGGGAEPPFGADAAAGERFPDVALTACDGRRTTRAEERCQRALTIPSPTKAEIVSDAV